MTDKFQNKYRIASARLQNWDYGNDGAYFITICTQNREHYFGEIGNGIMHLSNLGVIADIFWHEIKHHAQNVELDAFVVMPNHIHGILILNDNKNNIENHSTDNFVDGIVETRHALSLQYHQQSPPSQQPEKTIGQQRFQNQGKNTVSSIIGGYKSAVTKNARRLGFTFAWQTRFYDHVIRTDADYQRIKNYIYSNPENWQNDKFYE